MFYGKKRLIRAHQNRNTSYYNHSYDREVRDAICSGCGEIIGEQVNYIDFKKGFQFESEKDKYTHCPYCGHEFNFNKKENEL